MKLRTKLIVYFVLLHLIPATTLFAFASHTTGMIFAVEALLAISLLSAILFARSLTRPVELMTMGSDLIREQDFNARFHRVGQPELDELVDLYNAMLSRLRGERLRAEEKHQLLSKLIEKSPAGVMLLDHDGNVSDANESARRLLDLRHDCAGKALQSVTERFAAELQQLTAGDSVMLGGDGRQRLRMTRGEFFDRGFPRTFYLVEELTEPLRASEKAAYEKVIRMLSHEINNSVGSVASLLDSLQHFALRVGDGREDFERALAIASSRLRSLDSFTRGFASVVGIPAPVTSNVMLATLLRDLVTLSTPEAEDRGVEMTVLMEEIAIEGDKNQLEQVFLNVLRNAIEATPRGGQVAVALRHEVGRAILTVQDGGAGIAPAVQSNLFTPFFTTKPHGRGLGLTIVQEILSAHRAEFSLRNAPERGALFTAAFPLRQYE